MPEKIIQNPLIDEVEEVVWSSLVRTISFDQDEILKWIINLHNEGRGFELDATYGSGGFYKDPSTPRPTYAYDLSPRWENITKGDSRELPHEEESIHSIIFDPPFVMKNVARKDAKLGLIEGRFSGLGNRENLLSMYKDSLAEFWRILRWKGIVAFKCQDVVSGGKQHWIHHEVMKLGEEIGFYIKDLFILCRKGVMWSPNMKNQQHARRHHCYFIVLKKE